MLGGITLSKTINCDSLYAKIKFPSAKQDAYLSDNSFY